MLTMMTSLVKLKSEGSSISVDANRFRDLTTLMRKNYS
jgi:hypothetical protein